MSLAIVVSGKHISGESLSCETATEAGVRYEKGDRMSDQPDLTSSIAENAAGPRSMRGPDGTEYEAHSLPDQIQADKHVKAQQATSKPHRGLTFTRLVSR